MAKYGSETGRFTYGAWRTLSHPSGRLLLAANLPEIVRWIEQAFGVSFLSADVYYISEVPSQLEWSDVSWITLTAFLFCIIATLYPAWRAARIEPAAALRYE